jgi:hypothetical protein
MTFLAAIVSAIGLVVGLTSASSAIQECSVEALAIAVVTIPYALARAASSVSSYDDRKKILELLKKVAERDSSAIEATPVSPPSS